MEHRYNQRFCRYSPPLHKRPTDNDYPRKLPKTLRCGVAVLPPHKIPGNATFLCILLPSVVTIISGHWPLPGMPPAFPLKYALDCTTVSLITCTFWNSLPITLRQPGVDFGLFNRLLLKTFLFV